MFCPSCGKENAQNAGYCNQCGRALTPASGAMPAAVGTGVAPVMQYVAQPRKKNPNLIAIIVIAVLAAVGGAVFLASKVDREAPEQRIGRLMREAAGLQPEKKAFFSKDQKFDDTFREQYRNLFRINKEYMDAVKNTDVSATGYLTTAASFADPASAAKALQQLHAAYDLDAAQEQKVQVVLSNIRQAIESSDWSSSERQGMVDGFNRGISEPLAKRQHATSAEQAWVAAIDDIYAYADQYHSAFVLNNNHLVISDDGVRQEFNSKAHTLDQRRNDFLQAKNEFELYQKNLFKKMGMSPQDVGLH